MFSDMFWNFEKKKKSFIKKSVEKLKNKECQKCYHEKGLLHTKVFQVCISLFFVFFFYSLFYVDIQCSSGNFQ